MDIVAQIKEVVSLEIKTLQDLRDQVDSSFEKAVNIILNSSSRVVVCGMGKSGHIAGKIAATLSSTGTRSIFMHPAEALHGDLGMVEDGSVLILLSKSGESDEMIGLLPTLRKLNCKVITITANPNSTLGSHSDIILYTPVEQEACALNLAPTCSTTAAMTVGDALAVTLMRLKNFDSKEFALYHPAGRLGKRLLYKVDDLMKSGEENPIIKYSATFDEVVSAISKGQVNAVSVVDDQNQFSGLITGYDIRNAFQSIKDIRKLKAREIMYSSPITIQKNTYAIECYELMKNHSKPLMVLPVLDGKKPVGMITMQDMIRSGL